MTAREYLDILHVAERLKDTPRHCTTSKRRVESVAEHSWRISLMAFLLKDVFPEADINKVVSMCLIHDLGECFTGDIPTFLKTNSDRETEDSLLTQWVKSLPKEVAERMLALYAEMDEQTTLEAKLYKSLDKLEALIQHNESPIDTWSANEYDLNKTYAFDTVTFSSWLTSLRKEILQDTLDKSNKKNKKEGHRPLFSLMVIFFIVTIVTIVTIGIIVTIPYSIVSSIPSHPSSTSLHVASKSPVYHGSATSPGLSV